MPEVRHTRGQEGPTAVSMPPPGSATRRAAGRFALAVVAATALLAPAGAAAAPPRDYLTGTSTATARARHDESLMNSGDDVVSGITLPFPVTFYGVSYGTATVSSNGNLQFNSSLTEATNTCLPHSGPRATIFALQGDLTTAGAGNGIFTVTTGAAPHPRQYVIEWRTARQASIITKENFEVILNEGSPPCR